MKYEYNLLTNGNLFNYPKKLFVKNIQIKHIRELLLAGPQGDEVVNEVMSRVLDDLIDFSKIPGLENSDDLTLPDIQKICILLRMNSKGEKYTISWKCPQCDKDVTNTFDLSKIKENKLEKYVKDIIITLPEEIFGVTELELSVPRRKDFKNINRIIKSIKKEVIEKINNDSNLTEIENLEQKKTNLKSNLNKTIMDLMKIKMEKSLNNVQDLIQKTELGINEENDEIDNIKNKTNKEILEIENQIELLKKNKSVNNEKVIKVLKEYLMFGTIEKLNKGELLNVTIEDLIFDPLTEYMLSIMICVKNLPNNILKFIGELQGETLDKLESFTQSYYHGLDNILLFNCPCGYQSKRNFELTPAFFLD
jgi:hypothetical protein